MSVQEWGSAQVPHGEGATMPKLVEGYVNKLRVPAGKRDVQAFDNALPGFGIRKFDSGRASYFVKFNVGKQQRRLTLGAVVPGNLAEMRRKASTILSKARLGQDVVAEKRTATGKRNGTLGMLVEKYLREREPKLRPRYFAEIKRQLERDWKPLHPQSVESIGRQVVIGVIDEIALGQGDTAADRARVALSGFYGWAIERGYCEANPTLNISPRAETGARDRALTGAELVEVWRGSGEDDYGYIVKLLILTGQRRREIGDLEWTEIDLSKRQIELPAQRVKNARPHLVPLGEQAMSILGGIERIDGRELVFGRGVGGFSGWSKAKAELDERIASARKAAGNKKPMAPWVLHDLRRSFVTHLNENKFALPHVIEAIVNHVSGHLAGVAGVYNKAAYMAERRAVLELWGAHLMTLLNEFTDVPSVRRKS
jgi:integrase